MRPVQGIFNSSSYPDLIIGLGAPDDAAVWKLDSTRALVVTTDFFTPVVDDAFDFGQIAAANSLSDVYAMGGKPFLALNVAALPPDLPYEVNGEILRGGAEKCREAGVVIAGGHTVQDKEPKYGLVVLGFVHPDQIISKSGARIGDKLVLTKPLGFGVVTTALKQQLASDEDVSEVTAWMKRLNREAGNLAQEFGLLGGTDITGFSLLGHAMEMANASGVGLRLEFEKIPLVSCARKYAEMWTFPGGAADNRVHFGPHVRFNNKLNEKHQMLLFDPQTNGGLLLSVPSNRLNNFIKKAGELDLPAWEIGDVVPGSGIDVV